MTFELQRAQRGSGSCDGWCGGVSSKRCVRRRGAGRPELELEEGARSVSGSTTPYLTMVVRGRAFLAAFPPLFLAHACPKRPVRNALIRTLFPFPRPYPVLSTPYPPFFHRAEFKNNQRNTKLSSSLPAACRSEPGRCCFSYDRLLTFPRDRTRTGRAAIKTLRRVFCRD